MDIQSQHSQFVSELLQSNPLGERARELRAMVMRLERIKPELERARIAEMKMIETLPTDDPTIAVSGSGDDGLE